MIKNFKNICNMTQKQVKDYVTKQLSETHQDIISGDGYVYAQGGFPVLLVAHMDTVHQKLPSTIIYNANTKSLSSPNGIGGDDRCGICMVLEVVKQFNCSVLFTEDEEIGGVGAKKFTQTALAKSLSFNYIIEFDRKGSNDAVFYRCDNPDFEKFITKDFYKKAYGSFSDISTIAPFLGCAAVNLSCGYYNAHTKDEYVVISEMTRSITEACKILKHTTENDKFEYIEAKYEYYYDDYDYYYNYNSRKCYVIEYQDKNHTTQWYVTEAYSEAEARGKLWMEQPDLKYYDIIDIYLYPGD